MKNFLWALGSSIIVSVISFIGIFTLLLKEKLLAKTLIFLVAFSAGALIGGAFLHFLPEALEDIHNTDQVFVYVIIGFIFFFILEKYFYWRHCHKEHCEIHTFTYMNLFGDAIHNFVDGIIIGISFTINVHFGLITTLVIILHEIPQELGDFGVLVYGGFTKKRALLFNFFSATTAIIGTIAGYYFGHSVAFFSNLLLPFAAGGFIYIAACDLIPELHKQVSQKRAIISMLFFISGILLMLLLKLNHSH